MSAGNSVQSMVTLSVADYFKNALKHFFTIGSIVPSSSFASRKIARCLPENAKYVAEYGTGNGAVTRELLKKLSPEGRLFGIEINVEFAESLKKWGDKRLDVMLGDTTEISAQFRSMVPQGLDAVVSGIPFSFLTPEKRLRIVRQTFDGLRTGGRFIVYQNSAKVYKTLCEVFGNVEKRWELRNFPPYFIFVATKMS